MREKDAIRKMINEKILALTVEQKRAESTFVQEGVLQSQEYKKANKIFVYINDNREIATDIIIANALLEGKQVFVPCVTSPSEMIAVKVDSNTQYTVNKYGIKEPIIGDTTVVDSDFDLVICPLVGCTTKGDRLGHGKGYYDRFLSKNNCYKIGLAFAVQVVDDLPTQSTDVLLDRIICKL